MLGLTGIWNRYFANMRERQILLFLFAFAVLLRVIGINYGYWHGDERINDAAKVLTGQLVSGQHFYPPLWNYINGVFFGAMYAVGRLIPAWHSTYEFQLQYFNDPTPFYMLSRFLTACASALTIPLFYYLAKSLDLSKRMCVISALFALLTPVMIYLSHISKSDVPLATSTILVMWLFIEKHKNISSKKLDAYLGLSIALALSFKHSYLFILAPLMLGHAFLLWKKTDDVLKTFSSLFYLGIWMLPAWCVMNIGILLDLKNFIDFQVIQAQMSVRADEGILAAFSAWFYWAGHYAYGVGAVSTFLFIIFPLFLNSKFSTLKYKSLLNVAWLSIAFGTVVVVLMSGTRQHSGLWVPYFTAMQLFAALLVVDLLSNSAGAFKNTGRVLALSSFIICFLGSASVWKQALAEPMDDTVAHFIAEHLSDRHMMTAIQLPLTQHPLAQKQDKDRHYRLAEKYNIEMPEESTLRKPQQPTSEHYFYRASPSVMFGLENTDDESLGDAIKPYTWPPQKEEWQLQYWLDKGIALFVIPNFEYLLHDSGVQIYTEFFGQMEQHCRVVMEFAPKKTYFLERNVSIIDCQ